MNKPFSGHICVTGTIGSGKSRVARLIAEKCALPCIDVDDISRAIMEVGGPGLSAIKNYNPDYITADGLLDRLMLRQASILVAAQLGPTSGISEMDINRDL